MGTMKGLYVPMYGAFNRYLEDQTECWSVADDGALDITIANATTTADNALAVTVNSSGALASGYQQGFYCALNISSTTSGGGGTQFNAFATDISISGTQAAWIGGGYVYIAAGTTPTLTSAQIYGFCLDIQSFTSAPDYLVNLWLQRANTQPGALDAYILFSGNTGAAVKSAFYFQGSTTNPSYFLEFNSPARANGAHGFYKANVKDAAASVATLSVKTSSTAILFIPLWAATAANECSS